MTEAIACDWCGRAIARTIYGRWYAVKGVERGYDPMACEASDDGQHGPPDIPEWGQAAINAARIAERVVLNMPPRT